MAGAKRLAGPDFRLFCSTAGDPVISVLTGACKGKTRPATVEANAVIHIKNPQFNYQAV